MDSIGYTVIESPLGPVLLAGHKAALVCISFLDGSSAVTPAPDWAEQTPPAPGTPLAQGAAQVREYFAGRRTRFDLPLDPQGTPFQQRVWLELRRIPYGQTISYGELARRVGKPTASRAVGAANGQNPLPIVVPCHRVVGSTGSLTGFAGGLHLKVGLLSLEGNALGLQAQQQELWPAPSPRHVSRA